MRTAGKGTHSSKAEIGSQQSLKIAGHARVTSFLGLVFRTGRILKHTIHQTTYYVNR